MLRAASIGVLLGGLTLGAATANMNMNLPTPGVTPGPGWATQLNTAFTIIDGHDHSAGKGVKVPVAGMNFNAIPNLNGYGFADGGIYSFVDQGASLPGTYRGLYSAQSELWYGDGLGQQVQITSDGGLGRFAGGSCPFTVNSGTAAEFTVDCSGNIANVPSGSLGIHTSPAYGVHILGGAGRMQGLSTPLSPVLSTVGTAGSTSYSYYLVAKDYNNFRSPVSSVATIATGNATLSGTNYITVGLPTLLTPAAKCYDVLKGNTSTLLASCVTTSVNDTGQATSAYTPPTHNETGDFTIDGYATATQGVKFGDGTLQTTAATPVIGQSPDGGFYAPFVVRSAGGSGQPTMGSPVLSVSQNGAATTINFPDNQTNNFNLGIYGQPGSASFALGVNASYYQGNFSQPVVGGNGAEGVEFAAQSNHAFRIFANQYNTAVFTPIDMDIRGNTILGGTLQLQSQTSTLPTCGVGMNNTISMQGGGASTVPTKMCICRSDGAATPAYQWCSLSIAQAATVTCTGGSTTVCP